jgi:hypothetical protein
MTRLLLVTLLLALSLRISRYIKTLSCIALLLTSTLVAFTGHETSLDDIAGLPKRAAKKSVTPAVIKEAAPAQATSQAEPVKASQAVAPMQCAPLATSGTANDAAIHVYMRLLKRRHDRLEKNRQRFLATERRLKKEMADYYLQLCKYDQRVHELYPQEAGKFNDIVALIEQENTRKAS